jgi:hypothetical protein
MKINWKALIIVLGIVLFFSVALYGDITDNAYIMYYCFKGPIVIGIIGVCVILLYCVLSDNIK